MPTRLPALRQPAIGFAHRGARAHTHENTVDAFVLARRLGATGLESDVWLTADSVAVLDHDGEVGRFRRRPVRAVARAQLPGHIPTLEELYLACGTDFELSLDIKDPQAFEPALDMARRFGAVPRLWACTPDLELLQRWRALDGQVKLVHSTRLRAMPRGPERHAAVLAEQSITAVNLHVSEWTGGLTTLFHRFGVQAFGWDAQFERQLAELLDMGIDGVYSDYVDRLSAAIARAYEG